MKKVTSFLIQAAALACAMFAGSASALDLRSWDQKIEDASKRYVVLASFNNAAVLDKETQLVWHRTVFSDTWSWPAAVHFCLLSGIGARQGWRLPTYSELSSLVGSEGRLPANHPFTGVPAQAWFWSDTSYVSATSAYTRRLATNSAWVQAKTSSNHVLCVRGSSSHDGY